MKFNYNGLLDYQGPVSSAVAECLIEKGMCFDASDMGTGKTFVAGGALRHITKRLQSRFFVVCPRVVLKSWQECCEHFKITPFGLVNYEKLARGTSPFVSWVSNKNPDDDADGYFVWNLPEDTTIVFDEVHRCKGEETLNGMLLRAAKNQGYRLHLMSATAATNPMEMFSLGYVLGLHNGDYREFKEWCVEHGCEWTGHFGTQTFDPKSDKARRSMKAIHEKIFNHDRVGFRIAIDDLGDKFPKTKITADSIDMGPEQTSKINKIYDLMQLEIDQLDQDAEDYSQHVFAIIMEARRRAELLKVPSFVDMIKDSYQQGFSICVFVGFTATVNAIKARLKKYRVSLVVGGQSDNERNEDIALFQAGINRIIICNSAAGGVGISLHDMTSFHPRHSLISPTYSAIQMVQCFGRVRRQGGGFSRQQVVYAAGTIEDAICHKVRGKLDNINLLNDGDLMPTQINF